MRISESGTLLYSVYADDPEMTDLVEHFISVLPGRLTILEDALAASDLEVLARNAHQLKGASGGYGFGPIGEAAAMLEKSARASVSTDELRAALDELRSLCDRASTGTPDESRESC